MPTEDKALVASSEFNPQQFVQGIETMIGSLSQLSKQEDDLKAKLAALNQQLLANRQALAQTQQQMAGLDKTSTTYKADLDALTKTEAQLHAQQTQLTTDMRNTQTQLTGTVKQVNDYRTALTTLGATATKVLNENKGKTLFDTKGLNDQVVQITTMAETLRNVFQGKIDDSELADLEERLAGVSDEFTQLGEVLDFVRQKMGTLDVNTDEWRQLNEIVTTGEQVLASYAKTQEETGKRGQSLRGRLTELRTELVRLEDQGLENTKQFRDLQVEAGRLQDAIGDAQERIRVLSSDTKLIDFGLGVARGAAAGYSVFAGVMELAGIRTEDTLQTIARLNAVMALLNGLQEIQNLLKKQSVVAIVGEEIALKAATVAQRIYAVVVGTSTGALRAFRTALLATGIGAFIVLLGLAAEAMGAFDAEVVQTTADVQALNDALEDSKNLSDARLRAIRTQAAIEEEQAKRRITNQEALDAELLAIQERANREQRDALLRHREEIIRLQNLPGISKETLNSLLDQQAQVQRALDELDIQLILEREKAITKQLERARQQYQSFIDRLLQLQRQLRDAELAQQPQDAEIIRQGLANTLNDALDALDKDVRDGKLTQGRADILAAVLRQINQVEVRAALEEFNRRAAEAVQDGAEEIRDLQLRVAQERAELLRDDLEREARILQVANRQERTALIRERDEMLREIAETQRQGLISPEQATENAERIRIVYDDLLLNLANRLTHQQQALADTAFRLAGQQVQRTFEELGVTLSEAVTREILEITRAYQGGRLSYERYQEELTRIATDESRKRVELQIREAQQQLQATLDRLRQVEQANALAARRGEGTDPRLAELRAQELQLREQIAQLQRQLADLGVQSDVEGDQRFAARIGRLGTYAQAVNNMVTAVVGFWQQANEAEQRSLDRSIRLQERRVEAATRLAERGNAEYLRLEDDRLSQLQVRQENAARRQLAINAVLQTSQALTAFVSALAQGIATGGPLGGLAIATAVIGLIASGYAIIQNLSQNNTPRLKRGTKFLKGSGHPDGEDTVPAFLTKGEAVVPVAQNRDYHPAVAAIIDRAIPPEAINRFVMTYHQRPGVPSVDYDRLGAAAEVGSRRDERVLGALNEQNKLLRQQNEELQGVNHKLKRFGLNLNIDRNGLAISMMEAVQEAEISKRT